jgi:hypothetical protein
MAAKKAAGTEDDGRRDELLKELRKLIKQLDEEGLAFLIKQASTLIYNSKVDELNRSRELAASAGGATSGAGKKTEPGVFITKSGRPGGYFLQIDGVRSILDEDEVIALAGIAHGAGGIEEGAERLYRWLERNRDEIIMDSGLARTGKKIEGLYSCLTKDFAIRKK